MGGRGARDQREREKEINMANPEPELDTQYSTALQKHVAFFDRNKDGIIYPYETYIGFRAIGFGRVISAIAAVFINISLSYKTLDSPIPSPLLPIYIKNIGRSRHANDSRVYSEGDNFTPHRLDELFREFAKESPDRLSLNEMNAMRESFHKNSNKKSGRLASKVEWQFAYKALKDEYGYISKDYIAKLFDGSIFYYLEDKNKKKLN